MYLEFITRLQKPILVLTLAPDVFLRYTNHYNRALSATIFDFSS